MQCKNIVRFLTLAVLMVLLQFSLLQNTTMASPAPSATVLEWNIPTISQWTGRLIADSGKIYFVQHTDFGQIGSLDPATNIVKQWYTGFSKLGDMIVSAGKIWVTERTNQKIGRLDPLTNSVKEWSLARIGETINPVTIAIYGAKIFFTEQVRTPTQNIQRIGCLDTSTNRITEWLIPGSVAWKAAALTVDASGRIWFSRIYASQYGGVFGGPIVRLDTATNIFRTSGNVPGTPGNMITSGDGKYLWFNENFSPMAYPPNQKPRIARLEIAVGKSLTQWEVPQAAYKTSTTQSLTEDALGNIYYTDVGEGQIGKLKPKGGSTLTLNVTQTTVSPNSFTVTPTSRTLTPASNTRTTGSYAVSSTISGYFTEWNIPPTPAPPGGVALQPLPQYISTEDGTTFYFTENVKQKIAKFVPQYTFTEWTVPTTASLPLSVKLWSGKAWFTEQYGNKIGRLTPSTNSITQWSLPTSGSKPFEMAISTYGTVRGNPAYVFFTERAGNRIGRLYPESGSLTEWTVPTRMAQPYDIELQGSMVWFTEFNNTAIARLNPSTNTFTEWFFKEYPTDIAVSSSGKIWFTETTAGKIGYLDPSTNTITEYIISATSVQPTDIFISAGKVWFLENYGNRIARLDPTTKKLAEWVLPVSTDHCSSIGIYSGKVWFTNYGNNKIGKFYPDSYAERTVSSISLVAKLKTTVVTPKSKILTPTTATVTPTVTDRTGVISGKFVQWLIPTTSSGPEAVLAVGNGEVWFTEYSKNKIGLLG